jgi:hypothetical protein
VRAERASVALLFGRSGVHYADPLSPRAARRPSQPAAREQQRYALSDRGCGPLDASLCTWLTCSSGCPSRSLSHLPTLLHLPPVRHQHPQVFPANYFSARTVFNFYEAANGSFIEYVKAFHAGPL